MHTYSCATVAPVRVPVLATVHVTRSLAAVSADQEKLVYDMPNPNSNSGVSSAASNQRYLNT